MSRNLFQVLHERVPPQEADALVRAAREKLAGAGSRRAQRAAALVDLAGVLLVRYQYTGSRTDLDESAELLAEAVHTTPPRHQLHFFAQRMLVGPLLARQRSHDLAEAVKILRELHERKPLDSVRGATLLLQLGLGLLAESQRTGQSALLDEGIEVLERAAGRFPPAGPGARGMTAELVWSGLAMALTARHSTRSSVDPQDAERARELFANIDSGAFSELVPEFARIRDQAKLLLSEEWGKVPAAPATATHGEVSTIVPIRQKFQHAEVGAAMLRHAVSYGSSGDLRLMDEQIEMLRVDLAGIHDDDSLHKVTVISLAQLHSIRFRTRQLAGVAGAQEDLDEAMHLARAVGETSDSELAGQAGAVAGQCLLDRYGLGLGTRADLDEAVRQLRRAIARFGDTNRHALAITTCLAEALVARGSAEGDPADLDEAEDILIRLRERLSAPEVRAIAAARLAMALQHRAVLSGQTEDRLRATKAARAGAEETASSVVWGYDAALLWARWAWAHGSAKDSADAHRLVISRLYRLAGAQLDRGYAELALRRASGGILGRAVRALVGDHRVTEAVVAAEAGRGVLLSLALQRERQALDEGVPAGLRERFERARDRLCAAEASAAELASGRLTIRTRRNP
ncbi:MAG TPA: hypothetical protein VJT49_34660 [Amycolatopsis sp.]|uniref:hypothetical protein n=1 Tax=Amycolatopsis sp. TaxID=37632 RepID=UPI002B47C8A2|nr:hypothetical protein [Amycolatopsis sp.]HKS50163.1 hypothetical protein [Amycolatopsis sp.]